MLLSGIGIWDPGAGATDVDSLAGPGGGNEQNAPDRGTGQSAPVFSEATG